MMMNQNKLEFDDLLGQVREVENEWLDRKLNGHLCYGKGGGGPSQTTSQVTQTNLPEYLAPYVKNLANRAEAESLRKYRPYKGPRIGDLGLDTLAANQAVRDLAGAGMPGVDAAMQATAGNLAFLQNQMTGAGAQPFQFAGFDGFDQYNFRGPAEFSQFDFQDPAKFTDEGVIEDYMSPYMLSLIHI